MDLEINAMSTIAKTLEDLEIPARKRVLKWALDRFDIEVESGSSSSTLEKDKDSSSGSPDNNQLTTHDTFAELFSAASPKTPAEKLLVAGYWHQVVGKQSFITSTPLNKDLKHLGHGLTHISERFDTLMNAKPQLAIQLKKSGNTKQGKKQYKITVAGINIVKNMLGE